MNKALKWKEWNKHLDLAYNIVDNVFYPNGIKTHKEFVERISKAGQINRMIIKYQETQ